jgi:hypothetical protein
MIALVVRRSAVFDKEDDMDGMRILSWLGLVMALCSSACAPTKVATGGGQGTSAGPVVTADQEGMMIAAALDDAVLKKRVARYASVRIPFNTAGLDQKQQEAIQLLVDASRIMDELFWEQASPDGPGLRARLEAVSDEDQRLLTSYLRINYGAYDRLNDFEPFLSVKDEKGKEHIGPKPLGATYYPTDMTKQQWEQHLAANPADKPAFLSSFTVIRRSGDSLVARPYSKHYAEKLDKASKLLEKAAGLVGNQSLSKFLNSRAQAFLSNDYFQSDMDWMDVVDSPIEVTIGPYEVYEDRLFNYKAAFESFVTVRDAKESAKLAGVAKHILAMEKNLPIPEQHKNFDRGSSSPILVVDLVYSAGDTRAGVQTLAFNLPNDERVREKKGSKKVMLKNISHAKFDKILTPIAKRVLSEQQQGLVTFDAYFNHTLMHEVSHGLGPGFIEKDGQRITVNLLLKELYSTIEEAKADVLGMYNSQFLVDLKVLPESLRQQSLVTFLAGVFRSVRFGIHEAHGRANAVAFNYLLENHAYIYDSEKKKFSVDLDKAPAVVKKLANALLMIEAEGDYAAAKAFIERYGKMRPEMQALLDGLTDVPVDIVPVFEVE